VLAASPQPQISRTASVTFTVLDEYGMAQPTGPIAIDATGHYSVRIPRRLPAAATTGTAASTPLSCTHAT
jgi:hypothetical protein